MGRDTLMTLPTTPAKNNLSMAREWNATGGQRSARRRTLVTKLLSTFAFAGMVTFSTISSSAFAGTACDAYIPECGEGLCDCGACDAPNESSCDCGTSKHLENNPIFKSLDLVAGGIEKVLGLDRCGTAGCGKTGCDSCGCDSLGGMSYSVTPLAPSLHDHAEPLNVSPALVPPMTTTPRSTMPRTVPRTVPRTMPRTVTPRTSQPGLPSVPPLETAPLPFEPRETQPRAVAPRMTAPRLVDPTPEPPSEVPTRTAPAVSKVAPEPEPQDEAPAMQLPGTDLEPPAADPFGTDTFPTPPKPIPEPDNDGGSIFDALENDDPFMDDEVRLRQPYRSVRPTGLRHYQPIRRSSDPRQPRQTSTRRQPQPVVGNGLRPVSHNEPVELSPLGGNKKLAPYRPSR